MSRAARRRPPRGNRSAILVPLAILALLVAFAVRPGGARADDTGNDRSLSVTVDPDAPVAGELVVITVRGTPTDAVVQCFVDGRALAPESASPVGADALRVQAVLPAEATVGDTTLVVTSRAADGVVRSTRQPVTVRPRDPWLHDATDGLALLALALVVLALGTATIVAVHQGRRRRAASDATAPG